MAQASIDQLTPTRSLIDLSSHSSGDFGLEDYELSFIFDDIVLVEYVDMTESGDGIVRNGIYIPTNTLTKAWRKAKVILAGPQVKYTKVGDIVVFPNNLGVTVSNLEITDYGKVNGAVFLNESRILESVNRNKMAVSVQTLENLLLNNVLDLRFTRRIPLPNKSATRRMLCTKSYDLLNTTNGRVVLNYRPPKHNKQFNESKNNACVVWDILMQDYRIVPADQVTIIRQIPANEQFWTFFNNEIYTLNTEQKILYMES